MTHFQINCIPIFHFITAIFCDNVSVHLAKAEKNLNLHTCWVNEYGVLKVIKKVLKVVKDFG